MSLADLEPSGLHRSDGKHPPSMTPHPMVDFLYGTQHVWIHFVNPTGTQESSLEIGGAVAHTER